MELTIRARYFDMDSGVRSHITSKLERVSHRLSEIQFATVLLSHESTAV